MTEGEHDPESEDTDPDLSMQPKHVGARVKRIEDRRLLTGEGAFADDRIVAGALHVAFRRSDHPHALISRISTAAAEAMPGVISIYTARELNGLIEPVRACSRLPGMRSPDYDKPGTIPEELLALSGCENQPYPRIGAVSLSS